MMYSSDNLGVVDDSRIKLVAIEEDAVSSLFGRNDSTAIEAVKSPESAYMLI
jgi:hypothetical protein